MRWKSKIDHSRGRVEDRSGGSSRRRSGEDIGSHSRVEDTVWATLAAANPVHSTVGTTVEDPAWRSRPSGGPLNRASHSPWGNE